MTDDPIWQAAWHWLVLEHEQGALSDAQQAELRAWLATSPAHQSALAEARHIWMLAGQVPPMHGTSDDTDTDTATPPAPA